MGDDEKTATAGESKPADLSNLSALELIQRGLREAKPARDTSHSPMNFIPKGGGDPPPGGQRPG